MYPNTDSAGRPAVAALLVGGFESDGRVLRKLFRRCGWKLRQASDPSRALACLRRGLVHVVVTSAEIPGWTWQKVLSDLTKLSPRPVVVVASRLADERLWAEVLNLGGYDVLAQPFDRGEVERVIVAARRHFDPPMLRAGASGASAVA